MIQKIINFIKKKKSKTFFKLKNGDIFYISNNLTYHEHKHNKYILNDFHFEPIDKLRFLLRFLKENKCYFSYIRILKKYNMCFRRKINLPSIVIFSFSNPFKFILSNQIFVKEDEYLKFVDISNKWKKLLNK